MARARGNDMRAGTLSGGRPPGVGGSARPAVPGGRLGCDRRSTGAARPSEGTAGHDHYVAETTARPTTPRRRTSPAGSPRSSTSSRRYWATTLIVADGHRRRRRRPGRCGRRVTEGTRLYDDVAYGLPALQDGRWWTFVTGMFFAPQLVLYIPILFLLVARGEHLRAAGRPRPHDRRGDRRAVPRRAAHGAVPVAVRRQPAGRGPASWARGSTSASRPAASPLVGALSAVMQPVWRTRVRVGVRRLPRSPWCSTPACCGTSSTSSRSLLGVARRAVPRRPAPRAPHVRVRPPHAAGDGRPDRRPDRHHVAHRGRLPRATAARSTPTMQPTSSSGVTLSLVIVALLLLAAADGLRRGRRVAWSFVTDPHGPGVRRRRSAREHSAERTADLVLIGVQLVLLLVTYRAFTARSAPPVVPPGRPAAAVVAVGAVRLHGRRLRRAPGRLRPHGPPGRHDRRVLQPPGVHHERQHRAGHARRPAGSSTRSAPSGSAPSSSP